MISNVSQSEFNPETTTRASSIVSFIAKHKAQPLKQAFEEERKNNPPPSTRRGMRRQNAYPATVSNAHGTTRSTRGNRLQVGSERRMSQQTGMFPLPIDESTQQKIKEFKDLGSTLSFAQAAGLSAADLSLLSATSNPIAPVSISVPLAPNSLRDATTDPNFFEDNPGQNIPRLTEYSSSIARLPEIENYFDPGLGASASVHAMNLSQPAVVNMNDSTSSQFFHPSDMGLFYDSDLEYDDETVDEIIDHEALQEYLRKSSFYIDSNGEILSDAMFLTTTSTVLDAVDLLSARNYLHIPIVRDEYGRLLIGSVPRARLNELLLFHDEVVHIAIQEILKEGYFAKLFANVSNQVDFLKETYIFEKDETISSISFRWIGEFRKRVAEDKHFAQSDLANLIKSTLSTPIFPMLGTTVDTAPFTAPASCPLRKLRYYFAILAVYQVMIVEEGGKLLGVLEKKHLAEYEKSAKRKE